MNTSSDKPTIPDVFIIESLKKRDERVKRFEGQIIADILRLSGKNPKYYYFQSANEIPHLLALFRQSRYRYLHISSHANKSSIATTNGGLSYAEFAGLFKGHLMQKRLFFSACQVGNQKFLNEISKGNNKMYSVVAPAENIDFDHAVAIWAAFYVSMFAENERAMKSSYIKERIKALTSLFPVDFFYATYNSKAKEWSSETIKSSRK